jgi:hypothetical protein
MKPIEKRLEQLERNTRSGWEAYRNLPGDQWPDAALLACLRDETGHPLPASLDALSAADWAVLDALVEGSAAP